MLSELVNHKPVSDVGYIILLIATSFMAILKNSYAAPRKRVDETTVSSIEMQIRAWLERGAVGCVGIVTLSQWSPATLYPAYTLPDIPSWYFSQRAEYICEGWAAV